MSATLGNPIRCSIIIENHEKSMSAKVTQGALGDTRESPGMLWSDPESSGMMSDDFWKIRFFIMMFMIDREESASHPSPYAIGSAPSAWQNRLRVKISRDSS